MFSLQLLAENLLLRKINMTELIAMIKRNCKLFFKDKGMFFTSLITPAILLVLFATFLKNVYIDSFEQSIPKGVEVADQLINGIVGGQLVSSLLSVSCVTVAFCSNMLMVQDKVSGVRRDITMCPVKNSVISMGYYISSFFSTLIVCIFAGGLCMLYLSKIGWYLSGSDFIFIFGDIILLTLFGTALSSIINIFLSSQGQISAVGTIISSGYGFICGAYMPMSQFSSGLRKILSFFPGTYGTALMKNHCMNGAFAALVRDGVPEDTVEKMKSSVDCCPELFGNPVGIGAMYGIVSSSVAVLIIVYIIINIVRSKKCRSV